MQVTARSYLTAGVALVGAGAIALTPVVVTPSLPDAKVPAAYAATANVALAASVDPIARWMQVLQASGANVEVLVERVLAAPAPVLEQVVRNGLGYGEVFAESLTGSADLLRGVAEALPETFATAFDYLAEFNVEAAVLTLLEPLYLVGTAALLPVDGAIKIIKSVVNNAAAVINTLIDQLTVVGVLLSVGGPIISIMNATLHTVQEVIDGALDGDLGRVANAVLNIPADLTNAVLNGYGSISVMGLNVAAPGLLSNGDPNLGGLFGGVFKTVQDIRENVAASIGWTPGQAGLLGLSATGEQSEVEQPAGVGDVPEIDAPAFAVNVSNDGFEAAGAVEKVSGQVAVLEEAPVVEVSGVVGTEVETETTTPPVTESETPPAEVVSEAGGADAAEVATKPQDAKAERAAAREAAKAERAAAKAERAAEREAAKAERAAKREAAKAERAAKREAAKAERQSKDSDSDD